MMSFKNWVLSRIGKKKKLSTADLLAVPDKVFTPVDGLIIGMYVTELDRPWVETSFEFQGFEIKNEEQINEIRNICEYVYIDNTRKPKTKNSRGSSENKIRIYKPPPKKLGNFEQEILRAEKVYRESSILVKQFMDKVADGGGIDAKLAKKAVAECVNCVLHSPDAMLWLSQLKAKDEYTSQHSMNVCVLSIVLGRQVDFNTRELNDLGLCGMMHDMGKMLVPLHILNKPGKLEAEELKIMQSHASLGYELLQSSQGMFWGAIDVAHSHHERLDGNGYPRKVSGRKISTYCRMVAIADMYDAITSDRVYQKGKTHLEATNILSNVAGKHLDPELVVKFIESLGIYPPGCLVKMNNGPIAIVVEVNPLTRLRPKIIILLDKEKNSVPEKVLDLTKMHLDENGQPYTITGIVRAEDYAIDTKKYYQEGVVQKGFAAVV